MAGKIRKAVAEAVAADLVDAKAKRCWCKKPWDECPHPWSCAGRFFNRWQGASEYARAATPQPKQQQLAERPKPIEAKATIVRKPTPQLLAAIDSDDPPRRRPTIAGIDAPD